MEINFEISFGKAPGFRNWLKRRKAKRSEKMLAYTIYYTSTKTPDLKQFMDTVFYAYCKAKDRGNDMELPYYWFVHGAVISWADLTAKMESIGYFMTFKHKGWEITAEMFQEVAERAQ